MYSETLTESSGERAGGDVVRVGEEQVLADGVNRAAFNGMSRRDWRIFRASWLIGNVWWSLLCFAGVETATERWRWLRAG